MHTNRKIEESRMDLVEKKNSRENERGITNIWVYGMNLIGFSG